MSKWFQSVVSKCRVERTDSVVSTSLGRECCLNWGRTAESLSEAQHEVLEETTFLIQRSES